MLANIYRLKKQRLQWKRSIKLTDAQVAMTRETCRTIDGLHQLNHIWIQHIMDDNVNQMNQGWLPCTEATGHIVKNIELQMLDDKIQKQDYLIDIRSEDKIPTFEVFFKYREQGLIDSLDDLFTLEKDKQ